MENSPGISDIQSRENYKVWIVSENDAKLNWDIYTT
jgi:hypothetical protein